MMERENTPPAGDGSQDEDDRTSKGRGRSLPVRSLVPNLLTILALCAGLTAMRFGIQGRYEIAAAMILVAAVLDGLDGRVARYLKGASKIGAELDSLSDIVNFGVAPVIMLYVWALQDMRSIGWIVVLVYSSCMMLRLARFNVMSREDDPEDAELVARDPRFFVGVPAPAGAGLVLLPLFIFNAGYEDMVNHSGIIAGHIVIVGLLLVSRIPTFSFKKILIPRDQIMVILLGSVLVVATVLTYPWISMVVINLAYLISIIFAVRTWRAERRRVKSG